jgi:hypothetical protein
MDQRGVGLLPWLVVAAISDGRWQMAASRSTESPQQMTFPTYETGDGLTTDQRGTHRGSEDVR